MILWESPGGLTHDLPAKPSFFDAATDCSPFCLVFWPRDSEIAISEIKVPEGVARRRVLETTFAAEVVVAAACRNPETR